MTQDIELKKPYKFIIYTPDGQEISRNIHPGATSSSSVSDSTGDAGIKITQAQYNLLVNSLNNLETYAQQQEQEAVGDLIRGFEAADIQRMEDRYGRTMAAAQPFFQSLYPDVQITPFQYQSAVPGPDQVYGAQFQASRRPYEMMYQPGSPSPMWQLGGQALGAGAMMGAAII